MPWIWVIHVAGIALTGSRLPHSVGSPRPSMGLPDSIAHIVRCLAVSKTVTRRGVSVRRAAYPSEGVGFQPSEGYAVLRMRFPRHEPGGVPDIRARVGRAHLRLEPHALRWTRPTRPLTSWSVKDSYKARCQRSQGGVSLRGRGVPTERGICRPANAVSPARTWWGARYPRSSGAYPSEGVGFQPSEGYAVLRRRIPAKEFYRCQPVPVSYDSPAYKETAVQARHPRAR